MTALIAVGWMVLGLLVIMVAVGTVYRLYAGPEQPSHAHRNSGCRVCRGVANGECDKAG